MEDRRNKYKLQTTSRRTDKIDFNFDITTLNLLCSYVTSENKSIRRGGLINIKNVFDMMDMTAYNGDEERLKRIDIIYRGIEARLEYNLVNKDMIMKHIYGGLQSVSPLQFNELNNNEVIWVNDSISSIIKDCTIYTDMDDMLALITRFKATQFKDRHDIVKDVEELIKNMMVKFRKAKVNDYQESRFSLKDSELVECLLSTYDKLASPSNKLRFGTQALNILTGGGVESGRVYTILGLPGEGKSSTLLDMAIQLKRYNKDYVCKDPTKRPCIVLLIMENGIKETVQRVFSMNVGDDMLNYSRDEICNILKTKGNLSLSDNDPIDIIIEYRPNQSEDTSYLYTLTENLEDEGYEVICVIQDYLKTIKSIDKSANGEMRIRLGAIINEFKIFAILKDVPVITASQLNRTGTTVIDQARINNNADLVRLLGRNNVGESNLIIENSDWICIIAPEYDKNGVKHLGVQRVKSRYFIPGDLHCAFLPYVNGTIKFIEDYYSQVPVHKVTLKEAPQLNNGNAANGIIPEIREFNDVKLQSNDHNIFFNADSMVAKILPNYINKVAMVNWVPVSN